MNLTTCEVSGTPATAHRSPAKAWLRALELTAPIARNPGRILAGVVEEQAHRSPDAPALLSSRECLTYGALAERCNQYARWALAQGLGRNDCVGLMMPNRPEYLAIWLGISRTGCTVALLNTNQTGHSLTHSVNLAGPRHIIVGAEFLNELACALETTGTAKIWVHGNGPEEYPRVDEEIARYSGEKLAEGERRPVTIGDRALYIYTSGTTGLPKAANVSHGRLMQWSHWFAGMMQTESSDRLYDCLPMYHSVGGVLAPGAMLAAGGSVVVRDHFSASHFWDDVVRWDCTLFQYIGELCRYLMNSGFHPLETQHRIRMCCGNGLRPDIWNGFRERFQIPRILEFYAATEGNVSLFNPEGKPGAIGRVPSYLAHRFAATLVRFDIETNEPVRDERGLCIRCAPDETGEAIGRIAVDESGVAGRFEGYTDERATGAKVLRDVFRPGDAWFRTGDLMRRDGEGYYYFVDRIGDTFRWKGENVATLEVSEAICAFPGIRQAHVYGVALPGADGRAGMAVLAVDGELNLTAFRMHLFTRLPEYAHPVFVRFDHELTVTGTFKYTKNPLADEPVYFNDRESGAFVRLDAELCDRIQAGKVRL